MVIKKGKKQGSSMLLVIIVMMSILVFSATSVSATMYTAKANSIKFNEDDLFYTAESGFEHGYSYLMENQSETNYTKIINDSNVEISINKESEKLYRIRSEAVKGNNRKVVQGLVEDKGITNNVSVDYADLISKYTINTKAIDVGLNGSANLLYVNSETEMTVSSGIQVGVFPQPLAKPEDKLFPVPKLKIKHTKKLEFESMTELIRAGEGKRDDKENNPIITTDISFSGNKKDLYKVVFINADYVNVNIPPTGEVLTNLIIMSPGKFIINSLTTGATYGYTSIMCKELKITNHSSGAININPPPYFFFDENKDALNELINEFIDSESSTEDGIAKWEIKEMSY